MSSSTNLKKDDLILVIPVVALALRRKSDQSFLITRRGPGGSGAGEWEFPGGKVEAGETQKQALVREIEEELGFKLAEENLTFVAENTHHYPTKAVQLFLWTATLDEVPKIILTEHDQSQWCHPDQMQKIGLSAGDQPFIDILKKL